MDSGPQALGVRELCRGRRVSLSLVSFEYGGSRFEADRVSFGSSVVVLPVTDDGRLVLEEQWRPAVNAWVLEAPAGRVEEGESPEAAAQRELEEETGYRAARLVRVYTAYVSPGYSDEVQHGFIAMGLTRTEQRLEPDEVIRLRYVRPEEYLDEASEGVADVKTLAVVLSYLKLFRST